MRVESHRLLSIRLSVVSRRVTMQCRREVWLETTSNVAFASSSTWTRINSGSWLSLAVILTTLATSPADTLAQRVSGAVGVSATVLPPITKQAVELISFRVERDGIARLETTTPFAGAVSLIVMSTVSSSANGFLPVAQAPALVKGTPRNEWSGAGRRSADPRASRWWYDVELGLAPSRSESHDVAVRITYLIVPGT